MKNRLKLYNDRIWTYIDHKDKIKFRSIAFKNKKTVSDLNRILIKMFISIYNSNKNYLKILQDEEYLKLVFDELGGMLNK